MCVWGYPKITSPVEGEGVQGEGGLGEGVQGEGGLGEGVQGGGFLLHWAFIWLAPY